MLAFPPTIILRHRKENLKKCSLRGLEIRPDCLFLTYPKDSPPDLSGYVLLTLDAPPLSSQDAHLGLFFIDATWRYAATMEQSLPNPHLFQKRSLPGHFKTAYPRVQTACPDPQRGLATVEALFLAYYLLERDTSGILDHYYWKDPFLKLNEL